jgi:hypothetical protein
MSESDVVFLKYSGEKRFKENEVKIKEDYVRFLNKTGGVVQINIKAPREELIDTYQFFSGLKDMEPLGMDIAGSGDRWNHYFRGLTDLIESEDKSNYKFEVTLQIRDAAPRSSIH